MERIPMTIGMVSKKLSNFNKLYTVLVRSVQIPYRIQWQKCAVCKI